MKNFEQTMGILASTRTPPPVPGRWVVMPRAPESIPGTRRARVVARRRRAFERLALAAASTLILGLIPGLRGVLWAHVMVDLCVVAYVMQLKRWQVADRARATRARATLREERAQERAVAAERTISLDDIALDDAAFDDSTQPVRRIFLDDLSAVAG